MRRTGAGGFAIEDATSFETLQQVSAEKRDALLRPVDALLCDLPRVDLDAVGASELSHGRVLPSNHAPEDFIRAYGPNGSLLGGRQECTGRALPGTHVGNARREAADHLKAVLAAGPEPAASLRGYSLADIEKQGFSAL